MRKPLTFLALLLAVALPLFPKQQGELEAPAVPDKRFALTFSESFFVPQAGEYDEFLGGRLKLTFFLRQAIAFSIGLEYSEFSRAPFDNSIFAFNPAKTSNKQRNTNIILLPIGFAPAGGAETIPLTFNFEYHVQTRTKFTPYIGLGVGFFLNDYLGSYLGLDLIQVDVDNDVGLAAEFGFHYDFSPQHAFDFTIRFLDQRPRLNLSSDILPIETITKQGSGLTDQELIDSANPGALSLIGGDDVNELNLAVFGVSLGYSFRF